MKVTVTGSLRMIACPSCGELHDKSDWPPNHARPGDVPVAPNVIRDSIPAMQSQVDGSWHESKRGIRATYQPSGNAEGKQFTEIGNEKQKRTRVKPDRKVIRTSIEKAQARLARGDVTEKTKQKLLSRPGGI